MIFRQYIKFKKIFVYIYFKLMLYSSLIPIVTIGCICVYRTIKSHESKVNPPQISIKNIVEQYTVKINKFIENTLELPNYNSNNSEKFLLQPLKKLLKRESKRFRPILTIILAKICFFGEQNSISPDKQKIIENIAILIEFLHNSSLIIDDIEDNSIKRRNEDCIHLIYGIKHSICTANYIYFKPFQQIIKSLDFQTKSQFIQIFFEEMLLQHLGQAEDIQNQKIQLNNFSKIIQLLPTQEEYIRMIVSKTGSLLRMMIKFIICISKSNSKMEETFIQVIQNFAIAFQIKDDIINITKDTGKGIIGQDLKQKKLTLIALRSLKINPQFVNLFQKKNETQVQINAMIELLKIDGSIQYAITKSKYFSQRSLSKLEDLPNSEGKSMIKGIIQKYL